MNENSSTGNKPAVNVNNTERIISAVTGGFLLLNAITGKNARLLKAGAGAFLLYRAVTGNCPVYSAMRKKRLPDPAKNVNVRVALTVGRPRNEVYAFWRKLENLPLFMKHLQSVTDLGGGRYHWEADIPGLPAPINWDAEIIKEEEGTLLGWNALPGADIDNAGKVTFADAGEKSTELQIVITYRAPLGPAGRGLAKLLTPLFESMIKEELRNFKKYIETSGIEPVNEDTSGAGPILYVD
ncbi:YgaP-like transmembrane domain [Chitinophaga pinensis]|uniref:Cyclase/dehydrase n=1 Tax=Chitinophaga pinensis (strain ATCC 43595 / DSM 2588 / LMG 13176 / NBRC 15968 / NCIMB 11800 / UQM 2034) TaxID=485918 RepID=A0A979G501_CHIPD|nr:YgaP-like transmembrane domain [Chitinophaga pinensis]ACU60897.1 cyclase/dehydrase [Chitinophaga pinensis DSM 2588]